LKYYILYYDETNGDVYFNREDAVVISVIDSTGDVGRHLSYAQRGGSNQASYYDATEKDLKYAYANAPGYTWYIETVDSSGDVGMFSSIDIDSQGLPHIAYYDAGNHAIKYAHYDNATLITETIAYSSDYYGWDWDISLKVGKYDFPHILYYDAVAGELIYTRWTGAEWFPILVDKNGDVGQYNALAIDPLDRAHIAYYDFSNGDLKYIRASDTYGWYYAWVDKPGNVGLYLSIDLDYFNNPHIAYFDYTNNKVKYAYLDHYVIYAPMIVRNQK